MTSFKDLAQQRRSHRKFTNEEIDPEDLKLILRAALMSPTSKSQRAWQFVVVDDKQDLCQEPRFTVPERCPCCHRGVR